MTFCTNSWRSALVIFTLVVACGATASAQDRRLYTPPDLSTVSGIPAEHGMVVAQEKVAAQIGGDILRQGGNAVDAAVATGFAMAVTYPRAGNIGGGGFMLIHLAGGEDVAIDYRETAPAAMTRDSLLGADGKPDDAKSRDSALGIGVPGTVAGLVLALEKYGSGKFTLAQLIAPAIQLARHGMPLADDCRRIEAVMQVLGNEAQLAVDANGKFDRAESLAYAKGLAPFGLRWFEEPCHPLDFALYAEIASVYPGGLATGENLYSTQDVQNLVRFGGMRADRDYIQVDPPQAYGIAQYARTIAMLEREGWRRASLFPHGGNQMSLAIAAGFGLGGAESYPGVFGAFGGFADDAKVENGTITLSDRPGIGFEGQAALYGIMREMAV